MVRAWVEHFLDLVHLGVKNYLNMSKLLLICRSCGNTTRVFEVKRVHNLGTVRYCRASAPSRRGAMICAERGSSTSQNSKRVLFVCLGNICRSPSAEAVFRSVVEKSGLESQFHIDSCGTGGGSSNWYLENGFSYHEGDPADARMTAAASVRGIRLTSQSRPLKPEDLVEFDYIIGMDESNIAAIQRAAVHWKQSGLLSSDIDYEAKLGLMTRYLSPNGKFHGRYDEVPDPYYGGSKGFELVLDLLEDACNGLLSECI